MLVIKRLTYRIYSSFEDHFNRIRPSLSAFKLAICSDPHSAYIVNPRCTENSEFDVQHTHSSIAQLAEHSTVNRRVTGSSPVGGASSLVELSTRLFFIVGQAAATLPGGLNDKKCVWFGVSWG